MNFVCPRCKGALSFSNDLYSCPRCSQNYPLVCGIPDFRLDPDPYISPAEDRKRGKLLAEWGRERTYAELLDCYFSLAPDVPPDLAKRWTNHKLADIEIARFYLLDTLAICWHYLPAAAKRFWLVSSASRWQTTVAGHARLLAAGVFAPDCRTITRWPAYRMQ